MEAVLWVNGKSNKEFDLQMTGSQEVFILVQTHNDFSPIFRNLIRRKYFRIQVNLA